MNPCNQGHYLNLNLNFKVRTDSIARLFNKEKVFFQWTTGKLGSYLKSVLLEQKTILIVVGAANLPGTYTSVLHTTTE